MVLLKGQKMEELSCINGDDKELLCLLKGFDLEFEEDANTIRHFMNVFMNQQLDGLDLERCEPTKRFGKRLYNAIFTKIMPLDERSETTIDKQLWEVMNMYGVLFPRLKSGKHYDQKDIFQLFMGKGGIFDFWVEKTAYSQKKDEFRMIPKGMPWRTPGTIRKKYEYEIRFEKEYLLLAHYMDRYQSGQTATVDALIGIGLIENRDYNDLQREENNKNKKSKKKRRKSKSLTETRPKRKMSDIMASASASNTLEIERLRRFSGPKGQFGDIQGRTDNEKYILDAANDVESRAFCMMVSYVNDSSINDRSEVTVDVYMNRMLNETKGKGDIAMKTEEVVCEFCYILIFKPVGIKIVKLINRD